ncbi:transaldolase [Canibacter sp. lx-45]|uniref:transaldolase n=1 Tax=Canibacter zhuwentaonis TaxID=2837491 RepID=UPI001BDC8906|nr:transaldolase [Canibacter zhuwentaonis]MBT1035657.1 transaldolase [Canibacter zhuwentaonis]
MTQTPNTQKLSDAGVSIWLDDISRSRLRSGNLKELISNYNVVGVTTNPAIFNNAISSDSAYQADLSAAAATGLSPAQTVMRLACEDVKTACDQLLDVYQKSHKKDGYVSIEVEPELAHNTAGTIAQAAQLWERISRPNLMIKIPATTAGLAAITETIGAGISVNVTLVFSLERYREVITAFLSGLELAQQCGHDLAQIASVASFFVSRFDTAVDPLLARSDYPQAAQLTSKTAVANARQAYKIFLDSLTTPRFKALRAVGAQPQRLLWASTGVKDAKLPASYYVTEIVAADTVNTMPEQTLFAAAKTSDTISPDSVTANFANSAAIIARLATYGISYDDITAQLEREGLEKFERAWHELLQTVTQKQAEALSNNAQ